ncbi:MAG: hypothetical protein R3B48_28125 [Kofleriaceae bacterium]
MLPSAAHHPAASTLPHPSIPRESQSFAEDVLTLSRPARLRRAARAMWRFARDPYDTPAVLEFSMLVNARAIVAVA